jgi:hypothetical protein
MKDYRTKQEQFKVDFVKVSNAADFLNLLFFFLLLMVLPSKRAAQKHKKTKLILVFYWIYRKILWFIFLSGTTSNASFTSDPLPIVRRPCISCRIILFAA